MSQRRIAPAVKVNRKTVVRKFLFLAPLATEALAYFNSKFPKATEVQFDEMESFVHTKCKPLSIPMAVENKTRRILGFDVASMSAKGPLSRISLKRYGPRQDDRKTARVGLLEMLKESVSAHALFRSDKHPSYPEEILRVFPHAQHETVKGKRGAVTGQGELKKTKWDPLFSFNHTAAMLRENVNRLKRRTWCTTKKPDRLKMHITIYALYHNLSLNLI
jgi:hypothetical protein